MNLSATMNPSRIPKDRIFVTRLPGLPLAQFAFTFSRDKQVKLFGLDPNTAYVMITTIDDVKIRLCVADVPEITAGGIYTPEINFFMYGAQSDSVGSMLPEDKDPQFYIDLFNKLLNGLHREHVFGRKTI